MSKGLSINVSSVLIDEKGVFDLNSDHVIISVKLRGITQILKKQDSCSSIKHFWKFTDDTDWELFRCISKISGLTFRIMLMIYGRRGSTS